MAPAGLDNQFRSLMFNVHVLSGTRFYWVFNKGGNKVEANRLKNKTQKNLLGLWRRAFGQSLAVFCFVLLWLFFGGRGVGNGVGMGVWAFSWCFVDWKVVKRACCLAKKKQSFMNSVIEILLKGKNNHRSKFCFWNSTNKKLQFYSSFKMTRGASVQIDLIKYCNTDNPWQNSYQVTMI